MTVLIALAGLAALTALAPLTGCVTRELVIDSEPRGAEVYVNRQYAGKTPLAVRFTWYGDYEIEFDREGCARARELCALPIPWWGYEPFCLLTEVALPFTISYRRNVRVKLPPCPEPDLRAALARAARASEGRPVLPGGASVDLRDEFSRSRKGRPTQ